MGGKGSGGPRVGAGRKPQDLAAGALTGSRRARARAKATNQTEPASAESAQSPDVQIPQPPGSLTLDELAEWQDLAPRALKEGTLTESTRLALRDLCQARVLKDRLLRKVNDHGAVVLTKDGNLAAHPLLTRFTTLFQRIEAGMMRFKLAPIGKDMTEPAKPTDPFAEFDGATKPGDGETVN
jgi:hypothetical protein